jgi:hypothetical protein
MLAMKPAARKGCSIFRGESLRLRLVQTEGCAWPPPLRSLRPVRLPACPLNNPKPGENHMTPTQTEFTVIMDMSVEDLLDSLFNAPMDAICAIDQINMELPKLHKPERPSLWRPFRKNSLRLYRGRFEWADVGFTYVQFGTALHIMDAWIDYDHGSRSRRNEVDCVFGSFSQKVEP